MKNIILEKTINELDIDFQSLFIEELCILLNLQIHLLKKDELIKELGIYKTSSDWYEAFTNACRKRNKKKLIKERRDLSLEEEKIFEIKFFNILLENETKLINDEIYDKIKKRIKEENNENNNYYKISMKNNKEWLKIVYDL